MVDAELCWYGHGGRSGAKGIGRYANVGLREQLRVGLGLREAQTKERRSGGGDTGKKSRKRKRLILTNISAAETWNVANQTKPEMIIEETKASANNRLGIDRPGETDARLDSRKAIYRVVERTAVAVLSFSSRQSPAVWFPGLYLFRVSICLGSLIEPRKDT